MYKIGNQYLYDLRTLVTYIGENGNYYMFESATTKYNISKYATQSIREPFKYISF